MQNIPSELIITVKNYIYITSFKTKGSPDLGQTGMACQQGTLTLPDTWFRPQLWDLLVLELLRPDSSNLPCLFSTFHLEYPLVLSRFCFWLRFTDEGSVPEMRKWSMLLIKSDLKWCVHLSRSLFFIFALNCDFHLLAVATRTGYMSDIVWKLLIKQSWRAKQAKKIFETLRF